ncbi:molecular chaperone Hsp20 [Bosea sp. Root483D1]|uniref:Hsp20 family protein n=1 Tax=Bosea sp. Root483D1 TaxID=1736544 RepID=UPI00070B46A2|nr:Hsp20 family protein [Bosea sp. Root483D1]KRE21683.1 molecular chaperone Hsp20 [Bosea sp. Root483D1]
MRTVSDFSPLYRSSIGFDRVFNALEAASGLDPAGSSWPHYDILKSGDNDYRIVMAVAGFGPDDLTIMHEPNVLLVSGQKTSEDNREYLHHGIAERGFQRRFGLADHVQVMAASLENGLLTIDLRHELPEALKPRRVQIATRRMTKSAARQIEAEKTAA